MDWYGPRGRRLRIRSTTDPWAILVAEVMAQQTQITRVDAAWARFMERYPDAAALARASTAQVLRDWAGLGYNRRALNLQRAARVITGEHRGRVPGTVAELEALPGVGPYTARAVAATAFGLPVAAVDTNVRRVVTRVLGRTLRPAELQAAADALLYRADPAAWTHAAMDLGATVCTARSPDCSICPVASWCASAGRVLDDTVTRAGGSGAAGGSGPALPFEHTSRWLRGRIIDRLRALDDGAWQQLPDAIGVHDARAIAAAVDSLRSDGLLERREDGAVRLPSAHA